MHLIYSRKIKLFKELSAELKTENGIFKERANNLEGIKTQLNDDLVVEKIKLEESNNNNQQLLTEKIKMKADLDNLNQQYAKLEEDKGGMQQAFENLSNKIIKEQSISFSKEQLKGMNAILNPLKEKIKSFEEKATLNAKDYTEGQSAMKEQIRLLHQQSQRVANDANNLAKALKGDFKKQGNWGEMILESVLNKSGLEKGREYLVQECETDEEGNRKQPDVVITLPEGKKFIIDSKVSLRAFEASINAESEEEKNSYLKAHSLAVKNHIDGLSAKNYHDLYETESPDFVLMFIPIDDAFSAALRHNNDLYEYGHVKNVILVTPSTLLATLKTIESIWRNEKQNRNALAIAKEAGSMYNKFVSFVGDMDKIGKQLATVQSTYDISFKKLTEGRGNLVSKAEKIKALGAKASKSLGDVKGLTIVEDEAA